MIEINFLKINKEHYQYLEILLNSVPSFTKERVLKYDQKEDQLRGVIGRLILKKLLILANYPLTVLEEIKLDQYNRPYLNSEIDFNIAHSDAYVICAISKSTKLGVDIEKIKPIEIDDFNIFLSETELKELLKSKTPLTSYFDLFTQKEAVSKAIGIGLEISLPDIKIRNNVAVCKKEKWNLVKLAIDKDYKAHIAFKKGEEIRIKELKIEDLLSIL
jgi:4'-phosphopantetheinyl transferase